MTGIYAEAMLRLAPTEQGGLDRLVVAGTRDLVKVGAVIQVIGRRALVPGATELPVMIRFWAGLG